MTVVWAATFVRLYGMIFSQINLLLAMPCCTNIRIRIYKTYIHSVLTVSHPCCNTCWMTASKAAACRRHSFPRVLTPSHFRPSSPYVPKFFPFWNPYGPDLVTLDGIEQSASRKIHAWSPLAVKPSFADISLSCETPLRPMLRRPLGHNMNPLPVLMVAPRMACLLRRSGL